MQRVNYKNDQTQYWQNRLFAKTKYEKLTQIANNVACQM
jgi:hypothetical protein